MKKMLLLFVISLFVFTLVGCGHIEDTNGEEDYSLTTITDENILSGYGSSTQSGSIYSETSMNGITTYKIKVSKFSGVKKLYEKEISNNYSLNIKCTLKSGNMKLLLLKDGEIFADILSSKEITKSYDLTSGEYEFIVAGESAKYEIEIILRKK